MAKLKDNSGKTILMALAFLLAAMMISLVLVIAAVDNMRVLRNDRESRQACLAVESAASLMKDSLDAATDPSNTYVKYEMVLTNKNTKVEKKPHDFYVDKASGPLSGVLMKAVDFVDTYSADYVSDFTVDCDGLDTVYGKLTMLSREVEDEDGRKRPKYSVTVWLHLAEDVPYNYNMYISADAATVNGTRTGEQTQGTTVYTTVEYSTTFKWENPRIEKGVPEV